MFGKLLLITGLVATGLLLLIVNMTTPSTSDATAILAVFLLGYIVVVIATTYLLWVIDRIILRVGKEFGILKPRDPLRLRRSYYFASVIALAPIIIISLQSVGGIGVYEICLIALFVGLGCLYVAKRTN